MADRAKNLRKTLSKNRLNKQQSNSDNQVKPEVPPNPFVNPLRQSSPLAQTDPLNMNHHGYQPSMPLSEVDPLKFFDLINSANEEKKQKEKEKSLQILEELNNLQIPKNEPQTNPILSLHKEPITANPNASNKITSLLNRMKKSKEEKAPMKVIGNIPKGDEPKEEIKIENVPGKLGPKEMDETQKNRLMLRMSSAKQGVSKSLIGKVMLKKASEAILEKANRLEKKISEGSIKTYEELNKEISNESNFVLKDSDVQQVQESEVKIDSTGDNKNIDIASFMNNNNNTKNVNDIIMNRPTRNVKKKTIPLKLDEEDKK